MIQPSYCGAEGRPSRNARPRTARSWTSLVISRGPGKTQRPFKKLRKDPELEPRPRCKSSNTRCRPTALDWQRCSLRSKTPKSRKLPWCKSEETMKSPVACANSCTSWAQPEYVLQLTLRRASKRRFRRTCWECRTAEPRRKLSLSARLSMVGVQVSVARAVKQMEHEAEVRMVKAAAGDRI